MGNPLSYLMKHIGWLGFGYSPPKLRVGGEEIETDVFEHQVDEVVRQVELLEWELRRVRLDRQR